MRSLQAAFWDRMTVPWKQAFAEGMFREAKIDRGLTWCSCVFVLHSVDCKALLSSSVTGTDEQAVVNTHHDQ